jgi:hypothetical protein
METDEKLINELREDYISYISGLGADDFNGYLQGVVEKCVDHHALLYGQLLRRVKAAEDCAEELRGERDEARQNHKLVHEDREKLRKERDVMADNLQDQIAHANRMSASLGERNAELAKIVKERDQWMEIAKDWAGAAAEAQQPREFYTEYSEKTMYAMQALLTKAVKERDDALKERDELKIKLQKEYGTNNYLLLCQANKEIKRLMQQNAVLGESRADLKSQLATEKPVEDESIRVQVSQIMNNHNGPPLRARAEQIIALIAAPLRQEIAKLKNSAGYDYASKEAVLIAEVERLKESREFASHPRIKPWIMELVKEIDRLNVMSEGKNKHYENIIRDLHKENKRLGEMKSI